MQRIKRSISPSVLSNYIKTINHVHDFSNTLLKEPDDFSKICKIFDKLSRPKIGELLLQYGRKNLVTTIHFEQRIKEQLNTRFDYYFWECCL